MTEPEPSLELTEAEWEWVRQQHQIINADYQDRRGTESYERKRFIDFLLRIEAGRRTTDYWLRQSTYQLRENEKERALWGAADWLVAVRKERMGE